MKFLVLSRFRPDVPSGGASLRNLQTIHALSQLGEVDVLIIGLEPWTVPQADRSRWQAFDTPSLLKRQGLWERFKRKVRRRAGWVHAIVDNFTFDDVHRAIARRTREKQYDFVVIEEIPLVAYASAIASGKIVYDAHNVEVNLRPEGPDRLRLMRHESRILAEANIVWCCSTRDAEEFGRVFPFSRRLDVVPNGVDVSQYPATENAYADWSALPITVLYPAIFSYRPNHEAALYLIKNVLPEIQKRGRKAKIQLVGRNPQPELIELAKGRDDIVVTGAVESVLPYFREPCIFGLPIFSGSGTRLKILEAFASRRAVVTTAKGCEGIACEDGRELLIRETPDAFADALIRVWDNPAERKRLCDNARALVDSSYSWNTAAALIKESLTAHV